MGQAGAGWIGLPCFAGATHQHHIISILAGSTPLAENARKCQDRECEPTLPINVKMPRSH